MAQRSKKSGLPPGTLLHIGKRHQEETKVTWIEYREEEMTEAVVGSIDEALLIRESKENSWVNIDGLHDIELIEKMGHHFGLDGLLLEDLLDTGHRPKVEEHDGHLFVTLKMLGISADGEEIVTEQVSMVLGETWLLSFQEVEGDIFGYIRERLRDGKTKIRQKGVDYLLYRLIDTVVDNYFHVTDHITDKLERLEEEVLLETNERHLQEIQQIRKQLIRLRRDLSPLREAISMLEKGNADQLSEGVTRYFRDVYEHVIHINETIEGQRDNVAGIRDLYMTEISNRMNQIMKVLTIVSTIFIPLTFIAGIYGMNFDNIPELHFENGYLLVWVLMILITIGMVFYFKSKRWL